MAGWIFTLATRDWMMMPGVLQPPQQKRETPAAMREANPERARQPVKASTQNQSRNRQLCLRRHTDGPRRHIFRHPVLAKHIPRMDEHSRAFIRAVMQESYNARIVKVLVSNVVANLYAKVSCAHAPAQFLARRVRVLQRHLAK